MVCKSCLRCAGHRHGRHVSFETFPSRWADRSRSILAFLIGSFVVTAVVYFQLPSGAFLRGRLETDWDDPYHQADNWNALQRKVPLADADLKSGVGAAKSFTDWCSTRDGTANFAPFVDSRYAKRWVGKFFPDVRVAVEYATVESEEGITSSFLQDLPEAYTMTANHINGGIVKVNGDQIKCLDTPCEEQDISETSLGYVQRMCGAFLSTSLGEKFRDRIKPRACVFEEHFVLDDGVEEVMIHFYHDRPMFIQVQSSGGRRNFFTPDWVEIPACFLSDESNGCKSDNSRMLKDFKPAFIGAMMNDAANLFQAVKDVTGSPFLRVDFFIAGSKPVFDGFSFTPDGCGKYFSGTPLDKFYGFVAAHPEYDIQPLAALDILREG